MEYAVYKLEFTTSVHFGNGMLSDTGVTFYADTLFSALYIEANEKWEKIVYFFQKLRKESCYLQMHFPI